MAHRQRTVEREEDDPVERAKRIDKYAARYLVLKSMDPGIDMKQNHPNSIFDEVLDTLPGKCSFPGCEKGKDKKSRWCQGHNKQIQRGRPLTPLLPPSRKRTDPACATEGCTNHRRLEKATGCYKGRFCHPCEWKRRKHEAN